MCTCSLDAAGGYVLLRVELSVIYIAVLHVRDIQPRDVSIVTKYPRKYGHQNIALSQVIKRDIFQKELSNKQLGIATREGGGVTSRGHLTFRI